MYEELISELNPKPVFNKKWYEGVDKYSEGDIEDTIIRLIAQCEPENYTEVIASNFSWSTYYHLTHIRKNILNWYPFKPDSSALEIGCGMGAITSVLCDNCKKVTAVEMSEKRATATLLRCREYDNLEIIVGNLNDIEFKEKFDYITLIGVLEYQGTYTDTENPYRDFLTKIKTLLKPNGVLLIAIENQYGLKYWCGAREDHTGIPFDGINGYRCSNRPVRTFSKDALRKLVRESGFENTFFYYPMPDYKLPTVVYSEKHVPTNGNMQNLQPYYAPDSSTLLFDEKQVYQDIIDNNAFEFMANSFLLECSMEELPQHVTFASMSTARQREYRIGTRFVEHKFVEKFATNKQSVTHIENIKKNEENLKANGINLVEGKIENAILQTEYVQLPLLEDVLRDAINDGNKERFIDLFKKVYAEVIKSSEHADWSENILYTFEVGVPKGENLYGPILKVGSIDMITRNAFVKDDKFLWFDQEWILENVPAAYVMYRAIREFYVSYPETEKVCAIQELAESLDLAKIWSECDLIEELFVGVVIDQPHLIEASQFYAKNLGQTVSTNLNQLMK